MILLWLSTYCGQSPELKPVVVDSKESVDQETLATILGYLPLAPIEQAMASHDWLGAFQARIRLSDDYYFHRIPFASRQFLHENPDDFRTDANLIVDRNGNITGSLAEVAPIHGCYFMKDARVTARLSDGYVVQIIGRLDKHHPDCQLENGTTLESGHLVNIDWAVDGETTVNVDIDPSGSRPSP